MAETHVPQLDLHRRGERRGGQASLRPRPPGEASSEDGLEFLSGE